MELTPALDAQAGRLAAEVFDLLGCRDMARVDVRVAEDGWLSVLEINPLPSFDPGGTVGLMAEYLGVSYAALIGEILDAAARRVEAGPRAFGELP